MAKGKSKRSLETVRSGRKETKVKSMSSPTAQTAILCQPSSDLELLLVSVMHVVANGEDRRILERTLLDLMLSGGLRVSEVLDPQFLKVNRLGQVYIAGLKGSSPKLVTPLHFRKFWLNRQGNLLNPFMHISRFSFYKYLKSVSIMIAAKENGNAKVTHAMRHLHVHLMQILEIDNSDMSKIVGHKSLRNIAWYVS